VGPEAGFICAASLVEEILVRNYNSIYRMAAARNHIVGLALSGTIPGYAFERFYSYTAASEFPMFGAVVLVGSDSWTPECDGIWCRCSVFIYNGIAKWIARSTPDLCIIGLVPRIRKYDLELGFDSAGRSASGWINHVDPRQRGLCDRYIVSAGGMAAGSREESLQMAMKFRLLLSLLIAFIGCSTAHGPLAYVTNEQDGTISVIDTAKDKLIATIAVGGRARGLRLSPDGRMIYVALSTPKGKPYSQTDNRIAAIDTRTRKVAAKYPVGSDPEMIDLSKDGSKLFASNEDSGTASIIDLRSERILSTVSVGIEPEGVTTSPNGKWVYVTGETSNSVTVIDSAADRVLKTFLVGSRPRDSAFSPDSKWAYVSAENGKTLSVVSTADHEVVKTIRFNGAGDIKPKGIAVSPNGNIIYVALGRANSIAVVDAHSDRVDRKSTRLNSSHQI